VIELPFFEDRHREFAAMADERAAALAGVAPGEDIDARCRALVRELAGQGWLEHSVGELDVRTLCLARERLAYHDALADFSFAMQGLGSGAISLFGTDAQKERLAEIAGGPRSRCPSPRPAPTSRP
jgi:acyl-CoA dehydrogenase